MAWNERPLIATGDTWFGNDDFFLTEEYFELNRLWNKFAKDREFDLLTELFMDNPDAIRLLQLLAMAKNIKIDLLKKNKPLRVPKRGPQRYSDEDKLSALRDWDAVDKNITPIRLSEFLEKRFGTDNGVLRVAESTFHSWRRRLRESRKDL